MSDSYEDIMNRSTDDLPKDKVLPNGGYRLRSRGFAYKEADEKLSARMLYFYTVREALDDVDEDELAEITSDGYKVQDKRVAFTRWLETGADWDQWRKDMAMHGIDPAGKSVGETMKEFKGGVEINAYLKTKSFQRADGTTATDNEPVDFSPIDD